MATYNSGLVLKKMRHRGIYAGQPYEVRGRIFLPAGTVMTTADILLGVPVGENQRILETTILTIGNLGGVIAGSVGRFQILDSAGNPVVVQRRGPFGAAAQNFTSPATSAAAYKAAGVLGGYIRTENVNSADTKLTGPANIGVAITTGGTVTADTEVFIGVMMDGEIGYRVGY